MLILSGGSVKENKGEKMQVFGNAIPNCLCCVAGIAGN